MRELSIQLLSPSRRRLVELMQEIHFGRIKELRVRDGEPILEPRPRIFRDFKFGAMDRPHRTRSNDDFALKEEVVELFALFDREHSLAIKTLEIHHGLPFLMTVTDTGPT